MEMGYTLLKNRMPSLGAALMWPVLSSPACSDSEANLLGVVHGVCFSFNGDVRQGALMVC
jgi:hypothetical protein